MPDRITFKLEGIPEFLEQVRLLKEEDISNSARAGAGQGAHLVKTAAQRNLVANWGHRTGRLMAGIYVAREKNNDPALKSFVIGIRRGKRPKGKTFSSWINAALKGDPFYWFFLEFGTVKLEGKAYMKPALANNTMATAEKIRSGMRDRLLRNKLIK